MDVCYSGLSDEALMRTMKMARMDAENAIRRNSPIKMILYDMAKENYLKAHAEYCRRCEMRKEG